MVNRHDGLAKTTMANNNAPTMRLQLVMQLKLKRTRFVGNVYLSHVSVSECQTLQSRLVMCIQTRAHIGGGVGVALSKTHYIESRKAPSRLVLRTREP